MLVEKKKKLSCCGRKQLQLQDYIVTAHLSEPTYIL